jgi:hypothetical protein
MKERIFDNPAEYSRYLTFSGMREHEYGNQISMYITVKKIKACVSEMNQRDMAEILGSETEISKEALAHHQKRLKAKVERLHDWQVLHALAILVDVGRIECVEYIQICKKSDKKINKHKN